MWEESTIYVCSVSYLLSNPATPCCSVVKGFGGCVPNRYQIGYRVLIDVWSSYHCLLTAWCSFLFLSSCNVWMPASCMLFLYIPFFMQCVNACFLHDIPFYSFLYAMCEVFLYCLLPAKQSFWSANSLLTSCSSLATLHTCSKPFPAVNSSPTTACILVLKQHS